MSTNEPIRPASAFTGRRARLLHPDAYIVPWQIALPLFMFGGVVWITLMAWKEPEPVRVVGTALLIASAAASIGALIGFLFGMPRANLPGGQGGAPNSNSGLLLSTHLQDVADWLTKLIVGAGLVQLANLRVHLANLGRFLSQDSKVLTSSAAITIVLYFVVLGFLLGYLWAELYVSTLVARVKRALDGTGSLAPQGVAGRAANPVVPATQSPSTAADSFVSGTTGAQMAGSANATGAK
jgi:hypothetical protein